ncbi:MAG: Tim44/TimA family putative adaptor protein [Proteobacteria bacterium]|nr:Tim44/TimA family putative adaptor protein [Pseudomonadota bacterium]
MNGVQYFDILLFALVAVFVIVRLGRVLGRRPGDSGNDAADLLRRTTRGGKDNVVALSERAAPVAPGEGGDAAATDEEALAAAGIAEIRLQYPAFDVRQFLAGARAAYEMVVTAFAGGDRDALKRLLTREVLENFSGAIAERESRGETLETTVVGVDTAEVVDARMAGRIAEVTVKFVSQLINVVRDRDGNEVGGPAAVKRVVDIWTFVRDVRSGDPNWALAETRSPA